MRYILCLLLLGAIADAQLQPISHALHATFDVAPHSWYQATFQGARYGAAGWDYSSTRVFIANGNCTESNSLLGKHPSNARLTFEGAGFELLVSRVDNLLQVRIHRKDDKVAASAIINLPIALLHGVAANNNQHCR